MPQIQSLKPRHEAIVEWLITNPERSLLECSRTFCVTQAWLSCIVHSDIFQARYQKLLGEHVDTRIIPLRDRLHGVAMKAVENLELAVEASSEPGMNLDIADKLLGRLGYGTKQLAQPGGVTINNVQMVSAATPEEIAAARARFRQSQLAIMDAPAVPATPVTLEHAHG